ncbi:MAG: ATP-dependent DNA helicase RecG [Candidatus Levyibacteriota bacterium]|nr:MAG: ATP-dependent DNA helicase RecG [Candidatus Levybacteria bacterium]
MNLKTPIANADRPYKMYASRLEKLGIIKLEDFLYHVPSRYEDYSIISSIRHLQAGEIVTIQGTVAAIENEYAKNYKKLQKATIEDNSGTIDVVWFNQQYITKIIKKGTKVSLSGKVDWFSRKLTIASPEYEIMYDNSEPIHTGRIVPIYPETRGVSSKWLRRQVYKILQEQNVLEYIPDSIIINNSLTNITDAIQQIHFPKNIENAKRAKDRLAFDELFLLQLASLQRRNAWEKQLVGHPFSISTFQKQIGEFWKRLPFTLTDAQKRAVKDIFADLASKKPMNRLLEGDVGSGKTVVSAIAMYVAYLNGFQSVLMAPTEILAQQHLATISNLLSSLGVKVDLVTSSKKPRATRAFDILVGTHAILSDKINLDKLGLVVIDEQQRFGVEQRSIIRQKGKNPHVLTMTATPIPRTVALTLYGDLDLSYLDEMPKGRQKIKTWLVPPQKRENAYKWINKQIQENRDQVFIICPFIEQSESMQTVKAAAIEFERLQKEVFPNLKIGLLHGKLKSKEKDEVLRQFKEKKFDILVATPVVEVGIDIQNATIMLIEASERFGLAQLHQLRGRVGRGDKQSYCLLFTESKSPQTLERLKALETMHVGAELAELDLRLRGPGEMYGTMQHGAKQLKVASFSDFPLIEKTRRATESIFPKLSQYPNLQEKLHSIIIQEVSPD